MNTTKLCNKCKVHKPFEMFSKYRIAKDGLQNRCKKCVKEHAKATAEKIAEYSKTYRQANAERIAKCKQVYRQTPIGKIIKKNDNHKRRTCIRQGDVTTAQLLELEQSTKCCYWCDKALKREDIHIDHYMPLSKGGEHTLTNLVVSCSPCNKAKYNKDPIVFANSIGRLI